MKNKLIIMLLFAFTTTFAQTKGDLSVTVTTSKTGGEFAPRNIVAIWVENSSGTFIKTLLAYGDKRKTYLNNWQESTSKSGSEFDVTDAITGATQSSHATRNCRWNGENHEGSPVDDGKYQLCMELTDKNKTGNYSIIPFEKNTKEFKLTPANEPSFSSIQMVWTPEITTKIDQKELDDTYAVFPTSSNGFFQIKGANILSVIVTDINGHSVSNELSTNIDLSNQPNGIYLVHLKTSDKTVVRKILKQ